MKTSNSRGLFLTVTITAVLVLAARNVPAQDSTTTSAAQTAPVQLSYGVSQIIQLSKAKVSEDTIVNYIRNSGSSYGMDASQIVYLKQQGVSDAVLNTMLNQPRQMAQAAPQPAYPTASSTAIVVAQPAVTYVQPATTYVPSSTVYVIPDTQTYRYYNNYYQPSYGYYPYYSGWGYPAVSFSFGFGGGYRGGWGGGYRGGYSGGYHGGGGGFHGGGGWHR